MVELLRWSLGLNISGVEPDLVPDLELGDWEAASGQMKLILLDRMLKLNSKVLVEFFEVQSQLVSTFRRDSCKRYFEAWVEPLIRKEGGHICGRMLGIIVCKLSDG